MSEKQVILTIDGIKVSVPKGTTVLKAASNEDAHLPIFCYHDRMKPFGACRVCLIEVEKMGKLQTACTLEAQEGMVVHTKSQKAIDGRKGILEFLLINHPLDCPICDKGGECPLQDHALDHGPGESRFYEEKRHFSKRIPLTPILMLDRERCILCARCTRFSDILAKDNALEINDRGYKSEIDVNKEKKGHFKFLGNTISICPVGALTSQAYRFRARPWDNATTKTTCTLCPMGCSTQIDSRNGEIVRTRPSEDPKVNDVWLCDKGFFGYEFTAEPTRLLHPLIRKQGSLVPVSWEEAFDAVNSAIEHVKNRKKIALLGGIPLTTEENYLFQSLARDVFSTPHIDHRIDVPVFSLENEGFYGGTENPFETAENLEVIFLLGIDVTEELPVSWLRLAQAKEKGAYIFYGGHFSPETAPHYDEVHLHPPLEEKPFLEKITAHMETLAKGKRAAVYVGSQYLHSLHRKEILATLLEIQKKIPFLHINFLEGKGNTHGARFAGVHPELGPAGTAPLEVGYSSHEIIKQGALFGWELLYLAGADVASSIPMEIWQSLRNRTETLIVHELFLTESAKSADIVLPALSAYEKRGTFITVEGRCQQLHPSKALPKGPLADGEIFMQIAHRLKKDIAVPSAFLDQIKTLRIPSTRKAIPPIDKWVSQLQSHLRASFTPKLFNEGTRIVHSPHILGIVEEPFIRIHPKEAEKRGLADGDMVSLTKNGAKITVVLRVDPGVSESTVTIPSGFRSLPIHHLDMNLLNGLEVDIAKRQYD